MAAGQISIMFGLKGPSWCPTSACATAAHAIGEAAETIRRGWAKAIIAGGGGLLVLESLEHATARGARILAELVGYGVTSDGVDMVAPSGEGAVRCMRMALAGLDGQGVGPIDYLNTHGTSTPLGDVVELESVRQVFGDAIPPLSSTKALSGHSLGAASVHEAIYCLLMLEGGFMAGSANIAELDPRAEGFPILRESRDARCTTVMSNSFGFGGTNGTLVLRRFA
jgi:3-oxoacyl-[acyl-carrier-protein] synthase-1